MEFKYLKKYVGNRIDGAVSIDVFSKLNYIEGPYPCAVFSFPSSSNEIRLRSDYILEIDFWDNTINSITISEQAELLKTEFNYGWESQAEGYYQSHIIFMGEIPTGKPELSRIQQRYLLKVR